MSDEKLPCGHPAACLNEDGECEWCEQVNSLSAAVHDLTRVIEKRAIVIYDGELTLVCGEVGYLAQYGGTINHHTSLGTVVTKGISSHD